MQMRTPKFLIGLIFAFSIQADAALISAVHIDSTNFLDVTWLWDGGFPSDEKPILNNWDGSISLSIDGPLTPGAFFPGRFFFVHESDPFKIFLGPVLIPGNGDSIGLLLDSSFTVGGVSYHFLFDRALNPLESKIRATASRVSSPSPFALLALGLGGIGYLQGNKARNKSGQSGRANSARHCRKR